MRTPNLKLFRSILPALQKMPDDERAPWTRHLQDAIRFDCRPMPIEFVDNSGETAFEEYAALNTKLDLPFDNCYFEFADHLAVFACAVSSVFVPEGVEEKDMDGLPSTEFVEIHPIVLDTRDTPIDLWLTNDWASADISAPAQDLQAVGDKGGYSGLFLRRRSGTAHWTHVHRDVAHVPAEFYRATNHDDQDNHDVVGVAAERVVGMVSLLSTKLLLQRFEPDPAPWWTRQRLAKGKSPTSGDTRVLTINVPAVRYAASRSASPVGSHESPCLHWRRGHSRTLHRGSEFESTTWVRRCLVGDPDKGFIAPSYRLTSRLPMPGEVVH
jgi:hypothetical protein